MIDDGAQKTAASSPPFRRWLLVLAALVVLLYAAGLNPFWRFQPDSALYMGLARSLARDGTYSFNGQEHVFALPGFPAMLSLVYMALGENFLAMNALVSLFGLGCVGLGYLLFSELSLTPFQRLACLLLLAFSRTLYYYSSHIMTDVPFAFFAIAALYLGLRMLRAQGRAAWGWCLAAAAAATAACAVRPLGPALLAALVGALWLRPGVRARWRPNLGMTAVLLGPVLAAAAVWAYRGAAFGAPLGSTYFRRFVSSRGIDGVAMHLLRGVPTLLGSLTDPVLGSDMGVTFGVVLAVLMGVGLWKALRGGERLLCIYGVVYLPAICLSSPGRRYMLPVLVVLLYWLVLGVGAAGSLLEGRGVAAAHRLLRVGQVLLALANLAHLSKTLYEARSPRFYAVTEDGRMLDYLPLAQWLRANVGPRDVVLTGERNVVHYFSGVRATRFPSRSLESNPRYQAWYLKRARPSYLVEDPADKGMTRGFEPLLAARPEAFERVCSFGKLVVFRVHEDRL
jgi:4-amino-4-deoxy-L-arabinose transferase-like glycosyltransferase